MPIFSAMKYSLEKKKAWPDRGRAGAVPDDAEVSVNLTSQRTIVPC
jgi:hypothetical protein